MTERERRRERNTRRQREAKRGGEEDGKGKREGKGEGQPIVGRDRRTETETDKHFQAERE